MSMLISDFISEMGINSKIHYNSISNKNAVLTALAAALAADPTVHDMTIQVAPAGLQPAQANQARFLNDVLLIVNKGKAGNLSTTAMGGAITSNLAAWS